MNPLMMILQSGNPQNFLMNVLKEKMGNNPLITNVFNKAQKGQYNEIEQIARNLCAQRGINPDDAFNQVQQMLTSNRR